METILNRGEVAQRMVMFTRAYEPIAQDLARIGKWPIGTVQVKDFPDGERYQRIMSEVGGQCIVLVAGTASDSHTLELFDLACALVKYGARRLDIIVPYFAYSTMERAGKW